MKKMKKVAWVSGASGLIGGHLMTLLSEDSRYDKVIAFVRKPSNELWSKAEKVEQWRIDYSKLSVPNSDSHVDDVFCALGSTSKKTPSKKDYYQVDVSYPLNVAELGLKQGAQFYGLVSAHGAKASSLSYYLKMKGQLELSLQALAYPHLAFARPSLLIGEREEYRPIERISESLIRLLPGNYKAIHAQDVAAALINAANPAVQKVNILSSQAMQKAMKNE